MLQSNGLPAEVLERTIYLNGQWLPLALARVSVLDRGFIFGDGLYEVVPVYHRIPFRLEEHLDRLERSLAKVRMNSTLNRADWRQLFTQLITTIPNEDQFIYVQITRGVALRDFGFPADSVPTIFGMSSPLVPPSAIQREQGLSLVSLPDQRWLRCDIKATSLLGAVLAKQEALDLGYQDCLLFRDGYLTESSSANAWVVREGEVWAPPKNNLILEGIRYGLMQELLASEGLSLQVRNITASEVATADEIILSSANRELLAVTRLDGQPVGRGVPGAIYHRLYAAYQEVKRRVCGIP